eukprot:5496006-Prymnesium_polylepis.1
MRHALDHRQKEAGARRGARRRVLHLHAHRLLRVEWPVDGRRRVAFALKDARERHLPAGSERTTQRCLQYSATRSGAEPAIVRSWVRSPRGLTSFSTCIDGASTACGRRLNPETQRSSRLRAECRAEQGRMRQRAECGTGQNAEQAMNAEQARMRDGATMQPCDAGVRSSLACRAVEAKLEGLPVVP